VPQLSVHLDLKRQTKQGNQTMGKNVGSVDKTIRLIAGVVLLVAAFLALGGLSTTIGIVASVVGVIMLATGLLNFCPLFKILGISSLRSS